MAVSLSDILTTVQNGVTAMNNLAKQAKGSFININAQLTTLSSQISAVSTSYVTSIASNTGAFTLNATTGITNTVNDIQIKQASSAQFGAIKVDGTSITATGGVISFHPTPITNTISSDIALNNTALYFDGPSVAQGTSGTWWVSGQVTCVNPTAADQFFAKLWDGTTVIDSGSMASFNSANAACIALTGFIASPAGNLRISVRAPAATTGSIKLNFTGNSKDSTVTTFRIA